jgi:hypothetical protein
MAENEKQCKDCKYFVPGKQNLGECHINPPSVVVTQGPTLPGGGGRGSHISGAFPTVRQNDWCGKFEPK